MSQLALITDEVETLVAQVRGMDQPLQESRATIGRMLAALEQAQRDPRQRQAALVRGDHLTRAERAVKDAIGACRSSTEIAGLWLAEHAAHASGVGGSAAQGRPAGDGAAPPSADAAWLAALLTTARVSAAALQSDLAQRYAEVAARAGDVNVLDGYVFGATAAPMGAVASALVGEQVRELLAAFGVAGGAAVGSTVAAGLLARFVVKHVAGNSARVEDAGEYGGVAGQIGAWLGAGGADRPAPWSLDEWAKVAAIGAAGIALDAALAVAFPGALSLEIGVSAGFEEWGWFQVARSHRRHGHVPGATQR